MYDKVIHILTSFIYAEEGCLQKCSDCCKLGELSLINTNEVYSEVSAGTFLKYIQGVYMYIKLSLATQSGDRLLPFGPHGSTRLTYLFSKTSCVIEG